MKTKDTKFVIQISLIIMVTMLAVWSVTTQYLVNTEDYKDYQMLRTFITEIENDGYMTLETKLKIEQAYSEKYVDIWVDGTTVKADKGEGVYILVVAKDPNKKTYLGLRSKQSVFINRGTAK